VSDIVKSTFGSEIRSRLTKSPPTFPNACSSFFVLGAWGVQEQIYVASLTSPARNRENQAPAFWMNGKFFASLRCLSLRRSIDVAIHQALELKRSCAANLFDDQPCHSKIGSQNFASLLRFGRVPCDSPFRLTAKTLKSAWRTSRHLSRRIRAPRFAPSRWWLFSIASFNG